MPRELTWTSTPTAEPNSAREWHIGWRENGEWRTRKLLVLGDREGKPMLWRSKPTQALVPVAEAGLRGALWAGPFMQSERLPAPPEPIPAPQPLPAGEPIEGKGLAL